MSKVIKFLENQIKICDEIGGMDSEKRAFEMTLSVAKSEEGQKVEPEDKSNEQDPRPFINPEYINRTNNKENKESDTKERKSKDEDKVMEFIEEIFGKIDKPSMIDIINMAKGEFLKSKFKK